MKNFFWDIVNIYMIIFSVSILLSYVLLILLSWYRIRHHKIYHNEEYTVNLMEKSPYTPGVTIVAPAYNEEKTVITNIKSLLNLDYPDYKVVIVNDGSKDSTLRLIIENFDMEKVPFAYEEKIKTKPFRALYKSSNPKYSRLSVVDKENGGTKADATNAGINVVDTPYFVCTDVDCIIEKRALYRVVWPMMSSPVRMIAVSATLRMSNDCDVEGGEIIRAMPPKSLIPLFQDLEYARSYLLSKSGFQTLNAINNVSGGFGLFDTEIAIQAGGYDGDSFAEDMDMIGRMVRYMCDSGNPYRIVQVPETCCWTEGPSTLKILKRQRNRWGRGLVQFFNAHKDMLFKKRYHQYGMITLPYLLFFELLAPVIELIGYIGLAYIIMAGKLNFQTFWVMILALYVFAQAISSAVIFYDIYVKTKFKSHWEYVRYILASALEPLLYHPLIVIFTLSGYWDAIRGINLKWGNMTRKGAKQKNSK